MEASTFRKLCANVVGTTIVDWLVKFPEFSAKYAHSKEVGYDAIQLPEQPIGLYPPQAHDYSPTQVAHRSL